MVVLVAVLAFLQYRWTNEATAACEMRIVAELESLMMKWHGDLYGEFSAICAAMQVGPDSGGRDTESPLLGGAVARPDLQGCGQARGVGSQATQ